MSYKKDNVYAILVGVGQRSGDHPGMEITEQDTSELKTALISRCGFNPENVSTLTGVNASVGGLLNILEKLAAKTVSQSADLVVVYFSGHGVSIKNEGYLVLNDSLNEDIASSGLKGQIFAEKLRDISAKKMLLLLDCCHAGSIMPSSFPIAIEDVAVYGSNRVVISACHSSQSSFLSRPVSLFSFAIIEGLCGKFFKSGDRHVTLFDLSMYVRERVVMLSSGRQHPELQVMDRKATENFILTTFPNGQPRPFFKEDFRMLDENKNIINLDRPLNRDDDYRKLFIIQGQINIGSQVADQINSIDSIEEATFL